MSTKIMTPLLAVTIQTLCAITGVVAIVELGRSADWLNSRAQRAFKPGAARHTRGGRRAQREPVANSATSTRPQRQSSRTTTHAPAAHSNHRRTITLL